MNTPAIMGHLAVVSPHFGAAVAACGTLLSACPGSVVLTVFAGVPDAATAATERDRRCGFADGVQAMRRRHAEDDHALRILKARPLRLDFLDAEYVDAQGQAGPRAERIAAAVARSLEPLDVDTVLFPLGLDHRDHVLVSDAMLQLFAQPGGRDWLAYEDAGYTTRPGLLHNRLVQCYMRGISLTPAAVPASGNVHRKATALAAYASRAGNEASRATSGPGARVLAEVERYWRLRNAVGEAPEAQPMARRQPGGLDAAGASTAHRGREIE